jgi:hypothetical protein
LFIVPPDKTLCEATCKDEEKQPTGWPWAAKGVQSETGLFSGPWVAFLPLRAAWEQDATLAEARAMALQLEQGATGVQGALPEQGAIAALAVPPGDSPEPDEPAQGGFQEQAALLVPDAIQE